MYIQEEEEEEMNRCNSTYMMLRPSTKQVRQKSAAAVTTRQFWKVQWLNAKKRTWKQSFTFVLVSKLILAVVDLLDVFFHVPFTSLLVFPERWNSSCSSFKGLITSRRSSAPLYEIARKAEQAEWQQKQPAYSKARDLGGTISLPSRTTKKKKNEKKKTNA